KNLELLKELMPDRIAFYSYAHIPDVKKAQRAYSEADLPMGRDKLNLYLQGRAGLEKLGYKDIGMDHFALPTDDLYHSFEEGKLHRNFMGYTPYHTELCIALGASAISDSWTAYSQNEKTVKEYLRRVNHEELPPVIKNHFLTEEDMKVRKKILHLICHDETNWFINKEDFTFELQRAFANLEKDGLVKVFPHQVKV